MKKNRLSIALSCCILVSLVSFPVDMPAQTGGKIAGIVTDGQTGEILMGANVIVEGSYLGAATDTDGYYMILRVPPGEKNLRVEYIGYQSVTVREVEVLTDLTTTVNVSLQPVALQGEEVVIVAEKPLVRKDLTSSESRIQADQIEKMPVQEVGDILDLQAGITRDTGGGLHIRGGRSSEISYMVNGISVTDDFYRGQGIIIENESVQELQVISGTFNAEYGNAMSGVINIVTKDGGNDTEMKLEAWSGDHISGRKEIFWHIDDINPAADINLQGSVSGPLLKNRLTYFITGRKLRYDGWLYGPNAYLPQGRAAAAEDGSLQVVRGDSAAVAMNPQERLSLQAAVRWKIMGPLSLKLDFLGSREESNGYNHSYRLNPNGRRNYYGSGQTTIAKLTHVLGKNLFYEVTGSYKQNSNESYLYKNPGDSRYVHPDSLTAGAYQFFKAGNDLFRSFRSTRSYIGKLDVTDQITRNHQIKLGVELQKDKIEFDNLTLTPAMDETGQQLTPFQPHIESITTTNHNKFDRSPDKFAAYIQDKIEYEQLIINIGLRFDYFISNGEVPIDTQDPNIYNPLKLSHIYRDLNGNGLIDIEEQTDSNAYSLEERQMFWYRDADAKTQVSPRFGIAYPITDRGVIHFSYGIFQQIPEYSQLFESDQMKLTEGQGIAGPFSNPDLNPQRTTMYELGLKQQISDHIGIDITGYYRDIRDWISTSAPIPTYSAGVTYSKRINRDFADVKGITLSVVRRLANHFAFNLDYTFQVVQGTNSSPEDEYNALNNGDEPKKQLAPLDWDQRHALTCNLFTGGNKWGMNTILQFYSGQPYTPSIVSGSLTGQNVISGLSTNSRRRPGRFAVDVNLFRNMKAGPLEIELFMQIYNLLDSLNPRNVWTETGKADYTVYEQQAVEADPTWFIRPDFYSEPRKVQLGLKIQI
ncbi:TonB-dependent receptor [bacterium]|nr:TonB-dependent receptor [bacterium]